MKLFYRKLGGIGKPIIILHGLYGASDNWLGIGKQLSLSHQVYLVDLRNHGQSPHCNSHKYEDLVADISKFISDGKILNPTLIGHSMGGKTAMLFALQNPDKINNLIVIDIAPKNYKPNILQVSEHKKLLATMQSLKLNTYTNRKNITEDLNRLELPTRTQQLILKNIKKTAVRFQWKINLHVIQKHLLDILNGFDKTQTLQFTKKTLFLKAQNSNYIQAQDKKNIQSLFPQAIIKEVLNSGHWMHIEQANVLISEINSFLK